MKRLFDITCATLLLLLFCLPLLAIAVTIWLTSGRPIVHRSRRVGKDNQEFVMPKFRTMRTEVPQLATHLLTDATEWLTPLGGLLRRTSLDELPQLWSVLRGDMSLVGPRPALYNQLDLIEQRTRWGVHRLVPGITGWAQIRGRDNLSIAEKVALDEEYLNRRSLLLDVGIILATILKVIRGDDVVNSSHGNATGSAATVSTVVAPSTSRAAA